MHSVRNAGSALARMEPPFCTAAAPACITAYAARNRGFCAGPPPVHQAGLARATGLPETAFIAALIFRCFAASHPGRP